MPAVDLSQHKILTGSGVLSLHLNFVLITESAFFPRFLSLLFERKGCSTDIETSCHFSHNYIHWGLFQLKWSSRLLQESFCCTLKRSLFILKIFHYFIFLLSKSFTHTCSPFLQMHWVLSAMSLWVLSLIRTALHHLSAQPQPELSE